MNLSSDDLLILGGVVALLAIGWVLLSGSSYQRTLSKRAAKLKTRKVTVPKALQDAGSLRRKQTQQTSRLVEVLTHPLPSMEKLGNRLQRAGYTINPRQFMLRCILVMLIVTVLPTYVGKPLLLGFFVGIIVAVWLPLKIISIKINGQFKKFLKLFPDAMDLIVRGLRSGLPVTESINLVAQEVPDPVGGIFKHIADTVKLGVPLEKALQEMAARLDSTEFNFFTTSIILQRETGGNLSEILNNLSEVLRKRYMMRMKIKAMTSEARASAIIVGSLPFLVSCAVSVMSPGYLNILWTDYRGNEAAMIAAGMLFTGVWTMNRMAKFEI